MKFLIIDAHCHFWEEDLISTEFRSVLNDIGQLLDVDPSLLFDASAERLINEMDEAGIDKTVILALDGDFVFRSKLNYKEYNNKLAEYIEKYPDRFIGFAGIDPRRGKEAIIELERCISELGCKGVKLWPLTGFYPDDLSYYPFYNRVEELGATVTLLIREIRKRGIDLNAEEVTILALGLYEDTGSFTFSSTTAEDLEAAAWLLDKGVNLNIIANMMTTELSKEQVEILHQLIEG